MHDVEVIAEPAAAAQLLDPVRARLLAALAEPGSAANVAARVGLPRQKVGYHLRQLEAHGLVELVEERRHGGLVERVLVATAGSYVVSTEALGAVAADPARVADRLSARYLVALAARVVRDVGAQLRGAEHAGKRLATLALDAEVRFASPADRAAFTDELAQAVTRLAARYHDETAPDGRWFRVVVGAHPSPRPAPTGSASEEDRP